jgi:tripartite-type tricarboxylate transporter receptor subunit TctC
MQHVVGAFFQEETGMHLQFEPYHGSDPAMQDLVAGQIDMMAADPVTALDRLRQQRSLAVAQATSRRQSHGEPWLEA